MHRRSAIALLLFGAVVCGSAQGWSPARLMNDPAHTGDIKEPKLAAARGGGFHAMYRHLGSSVQVHYRGFRDGNLSPTVEVHRLGFLAGGDICEAGDGSVHVVWENWEDTNEQIWWARSVNGGLSFPFKQQVSNYGTNPNGQAKNPLVLPFGPANSAEVLALSWGAPPVNALFYNRFNGTAWQGQAPVGQSTGNSYAAWGAARDPRDGSVYRCYGIQVSGVWQIAYRRFNGTAWEPQVMVSQHTEDFASRPAIAINAAGQVLVLWDKDEAIWARMRDPSTGWGPQTRVDDGYIPAVTAMPGRNEFYMVHPYPKGSWSHIVGRKWANGAWGPRTRVMNGIADDYAPNCDVAADEAGNVYCAWEYWGTGQPRAWFSVLGNTAPAVLTSPTNFQGFTAPGTILLEAGSTDAAAALTRVEFVQNGASAGVRAAPPFAITLTGLAPGDYTFSIVASNTLGNFGTSAPVRVVVVAGAHVPLSSAGSIWKYFANGTDLGTSWRGASYDDAAWPEGPAQLGFGEGDEATVINNNRQRITTYFRRTVNLPYARALKALTIRILRDDGAAVFLNGTELFRSNLPEGANYLTEALAAVGGSDETNWLTYIVHPGALQPGLNVLAVEVHQFGTNSSDLSFDFEVTGLRAAPTPPRISFASPVAHQGFLAPASFTLLAQTDDDDGDVRGVEFFAEGTLLGTDLAAPYSLFRANVPAGEYTFAARAYDATGHTSSYARISVPVIEGSAVPAVGAHTQWNYRDTGINPGAAWTNIAYNDSGWSNGIAQLGYGDGDEMTLVRFGSDANAKHITTWFRRTFHLADVRDVRGVALRVLRDDGAIAYLNGAEIFRSNMPEGPVTPQTPAVTAIGGSDETHWHQAIVDPSLLVSGPNLLAVEVHQSSGASTDLSFDAELITLTATPPALRIGWDAQMLTLRWPASVRGYSIESATNLTDTAWPPMNAPLLTNSGQYLVILSNTPSPTRFFRLRR